MQCAEVEQADDQVTVTATITGGTQQFRAAKVLVATGRRPNTDGLNLEAVQVKTGENNEVVVSDGLQSSNPRIWAAGDVTGHPEFVYVAAHHGNVVAENAFAGAERPVDYTQLPRVTFTSPAIGAVGMTESQVLAAGIRCDCRVLPLKHVPRAVVNRDTRGFIKLVADAGTGRIHGITAVATARPRPDEPPQIRARLPFSFRSMVDLRLPFPASHIGRRPVRRNAALTDAAHLRVRAAASTRLDRPGRARPCRPR